MRKILHCNTSSVHRWNYQWGKERADPDSEKFVNFSVNSDITMATIITFQIHQAIVTCDVLLFYWAAFVWDCSDLSDLMSPKMILEVIIFQKQGWIYYFEINRLDSPNLNAFPKDTLITCSDRVVKMRPVFREPCFQCHAFSSKHNTIQVVQNRPLKGLCFCEKQTSALKES